MDSHCIQGRPIAAAQVAKEGRQAGRESIGQREDKATGPKPLDAGNQPRSAHEGSMRCRSPLPHIDLTARRCWTGKERYGSSARVWGLTEKDNTRSRSRSRLRRNNTHDMTSHIFTG